MRVPSFATFGSGMPSPSFTPGVRSRLTPQPGADVGRDPEWNTDVLSQPFLCPINYLPSVVIPTQYSAHPSIASMQFWAPRIRYGKVFAELTYIYRGIIDGVLPPADRNLGIAPQDTTQLQTLQIADPTSSAVADVAFYCPQTSWRWVSLGYPQFLPTAYATINDPFDYRKPVPIRYVVRTDPGGAPSDLTGIYRNYQTSFRTERWGPYWKNEIQVARRYTSPFTA